MYNNNLKPHTSSSSDFYAELAPTPDQHCETANKISTLIESTPDYRGLAILIPFGYFELYNYT